MTGLKRNLSKKINRLLENFPVVLILGVRQCGKTFLAKQHVPDWKYIDLEKPSDLSQLERDPELFFEQYPKNVIIDEAQQFPILFNIMRGVIDADRDQAGRFVVTGSSSPELLKYAVDSLAGRVAIIELATLKANEYYEKPLSPLYNLFSQTLNRDSMKFDQPALTQKQMQSHWLKGGYPEPLIKNDELFYQEWMDNYAATYINTDIARQYPKLNRIAYQRFISMLAQLSGSILNKADIARALEVSEASIRDYLTIADGTYIWRQLPSYEKNVEKRVTKMPKGHVRDTGLLHHLLKINSFDSLFSHPVVGRSFEGFVIEELLKGLNASNVTNWQAHYYRTRNGAEIDLILSGPFGILPVEIKHGITVKTRQLQTLQNFVREHNLPFALLINRGQSATWLSREVFQLPVQYL